MRYLAICIGLLAFPAVSHAHVEITEIMYDLEGGDADGEWIEVYNTGTDVDLSTWRFFENDTNHRIESVGASVLSGNSYAVIADDPTRFKSLFPSFSGLLFKSSFSLHNEGERLEMRNAELETQDSVTYSSSWGAAGTGESLQKSEGSWIASAPTPGEGPGAPSSEAAENEDPASSDTGVPNFTSTGDSEGDKAMTIQKTLKPSLTANAGPDKRVFAGTEVMFSGDAVNERGITEDGVAYGWNFGDGSTAEGSKVLHVYSDPGKYLVTLYVNERHMGLSDTDEAIIEVIEASVEITDVSFQEGSVRIVNSSGMDVDLSGWGVSVGGSRFTLPDFTRVLSRASVTLRLSDVPLAKGSVALLLPSGQHVSTYEDSEPAVVSVPPRPAAVRVIEEVSVEPDQNQDDVVLTTSPASVHTAVESFGESEESGGTSLWVWLLAITALGLIGGISVVAIRRDTEIT